MQYHDHDFTVDLAGRLGCDVASAARSRQAFSAAMAGKLLERGKVSLKGLGSFTVAYVPASRRKGSGGPVYLPPRNTVLFSRRQTGSDDTLSLALAVPGIEGEEAQAFARTLAAQLSAAVKARRELPFEGFGRCVPEGRSAYRFEPEESLALLVNRTYAGLGEINVPASVDAGAGSMRPMGPLFHFATGAALLLVIAGTLLMLHPVDLVQVATSLRKGGADEPAMRVQPVALEAPAAPAPTAPLVPPAPKDSVLLEQGEFTLVLATFSREETALREQERLAGLGVEVAVWPAYADGKRYWRLRTGRFTERYAARNARRELPDVVGAPAYVQEVLKRVVHHGKTSL